MDNLSFSPIARITSCYKEKFAIPRQAGLVDAATAELTLLPAYASAESVRGLEGFSHIWVIFAFHAVPLGQWKPTVRPPRLGGNKRVGVFSTRSTHRPNPIGMSVVSLQDIVIEAGQVRLILGGCDLLDGTPVLDIKPYIPYADSIPMARGGFAPDEPESKMNITFSEVANVMCIEASDRLAVDIRHFIEQLLSLDPRPSYQIGQYGERIYAVSVYDFNLRWRYRDVQQVEVIDLLLKDD